MAFTLTNFQMIDNQDIDRFVNTVLGRPLPSYYSFYASNKGIPKNLDGVVLNNDNLVFEESNTNPAIYNMKDDSKPGIALVANWKDTSSFILSYFEVGERGWEK